MEEVQNFECKLWNECYICCSFWSWQLEQFGRNAFIISACFRNLPDGKWGFPGYLVCFELSATLNKLNRRAKHFQRMYLAPLRERKCQTLLERCSNTNWISSIVKPLEEVSILWDIKVSGRRFYNGRWVIGGVDVRKLLGWIQSHFCTTVEILGMFVAVEDMTKLQQEMESIWECQINISSIILRVLSLRTRGHLIRANCSYLLLYAVWKCLEIMNPRFLIERDPSGYGLQNLGPSRIIWLYWRIPSYLGIYVTLTKKPVKYQLTSWFFHLHVLNSLQLNIVLFPSLVFGRNGFKNVTTNFDAEELHVLIITLSRLLQTQIGRQS